MSIAAEYRLAVENGEHVCDFDVYCAPCERDKKARQRERRELIEQCDDCLVNVHSPHHESSHRRWEWRMGR